MAFTEQAETVVNYPLNGSATQFTIPFDYLARSFIMVSLFAESKEEKLQVGIDYNFTSPTSIQTVKPYGGGDGWERIQLRRYTSANPLVEFIDGSVLRSDDLNLSALQSLHIAQEARDSAFDMLTVNTDGVYDAKGRRITNMASGVEDSDAVTIGQLKEWDDKALVQANRAESEADRSEREANKAKGYAESALVSEKLASTSEQNAKSSEINAKSSELVATQAASDAAASAQYAMESIELTAQHVSESKETIEQVRKDADRAEEAANRVNDVLTHVSSIEKLKALDYAPNNTHVYVDSYYEGNNIGGGIFVLHKDSTEEADDGYTVAASGGGVWKRHVETELTFDMFGADRTGTENSYHQISKCFKAAYSLGLAVRQSSGRFKITGGNGNIYIRTDANLSGSTLFPSNWGGQFIIERQHQWEEFDETSPIVKALNDNTSRRRGDSLVDGWVDMMEMDDCFIRYETDQPLFKYRGNTYWRTEYNVVFFRGQLAAPLLYDFPTTYKVKRLFRLRMASNYIVVNGITIDESEYTSNTLIQIRNSTKVHLNNTNFYNRGAYREINVTRVLVSRSAFVYIDGVHCSDVNATPTNKYTYTLSGEETFELHVSKLTSDGYGWGSTGSNNCQRVSFSDSQLSRIDFHLPCREYLKVKNCTLGDWGILVTLMGDLHVEGCTWLTRSAYNNSGFIRTRSDAGGWCDGDLYIKDCKVKGRPFNASDLMLKGFLNCQVDSSQGEIAGSPINFTFFNTVNIDGLTIDDSVGSSFRLFNSNNKGIYIPKIINLSNIEIKNYTMIFDFNQFRPHSTSYPDAKMAAGGYPQINLSNVTADTLNFVGAANTHYPVVYMNNIKNPRASRLGTLIEPVFKGRYYINNSEIQRIKTYSGGWPQYPVSVQMNGGRLGTDTQIPVDADGKQDIMLSNVDVLFPSGVNDFTKVNQFIARCNFSNCRFYVNYNDRVLRSLYVAGDIASTKYSFNISQRIVSFQSLRIITGYDSTGTTSSVEVPISSMNMTRRFLITNGELILKVSAVGGDNLQVDLESTAGDPIRYVYVL